MAAVNQATWFIDPQNGSDANDGETPMTALATHAELERRWAGGTLLPPVDPGLGFPQVTVTLLGDLPASDPINVTVTLDREVSLLYFGGVANTVRTGSFTAVTPKNPTTNTPLSVTDLAMAGTWAADIGRRVRITNGAREGTVMWPARSFGGTGRMSDPSLVADLFGNVYWSLTPQTPAVGDTYVVEELVRAAIGVIDVRGVGWGPTAGPPLMSFVDLEIRDETVAMYPRGQGVFANFVRCLVGPSLIDPNFEEQYFYNCYLRAGTVGITGSYCFLFGGLVGALTAPLFAFGCQGHGGCSYILADDVMFQGCGIGGQNVQIASACVFDAVTNTVNPGGHAVVVGTMPQLVAPGGSGGAIAFSENGSFSQSMRLWGSGNAGAGVAVRPGGSFVYREGVFPTVTGVNGDFLLASANIARAFDDASGAYTTARASTWANLAAPIGSGGFNGSAHDVQREAHILDGANV